MRKEEKVEFIKDIIKAVKRQILSNLDMIPDDWNGIELRQYISDMYSKIIVVRMDKKSKRKYNNDVVVRNLL